MARGRKTGGRTAGMPNKRTLAKQEEMAGLAAKLIADDPLDIMLQIMRMPEASLELKLDAATRLAPYRHPRLQAVMHNLGDKPQTALDDILREIDGKQRGIPSAQHKNGSTEH